MSRMTYYSDERLNVITGADHAVGEFWQIYDREMENETPEGEGIVFNYSQVFGIETNLTGYPNSLGYMEIIIAYIGEFGTYGKNGDCLD